jgi:hypothetical protein
MDDSTWFEECVPFTEADYYRLRDYMENKKLQDFVDRHDEWARGIFPDETLDSKLSHLKKEVDEVREHPDDLEEWADCGMLLLHSLKRAGFTVQQWLEAMERKFAEVQTRKNWVRTADGDYQSIKEPTESVAVQKAMDTFQLARKFLSLPYHMQVGIVQSLGIDFGELPARGTFLEYFRRAREFGKIAELREAVYIAMQRLEEKGQ